MPKAGSAALASGRISGGGEDAQPTTRSDAPSAANGLNFMTNLEQTWERSRPRPAQAEFGARRARQFTSGSRGTGEVAVGIAQQHRDGDSAMAGAGRTSERGTVDRQRRHRCAVDLAALVRKPLLMGVVGGMPLRFRRDMMLAVGFGVIAGPRIGHDNEGCSFVVLAASGRKERRLERRYDDENDRKREAEENG